jgi:hypothetical protein
MREIKLGDLVLVSGTAESGLVISFRDNAYTILYRDGNIWATEEDQLAILGSAFDAIPRDINNTPTASTMLPVSNPEHSEFETWFKESLSSNQIGSNPVQHKRGKHQSL